MKVRETFVVWYIMRPRHLAIPVKLTILGSGDTRGTPKIGCDCEVCQDARRTGFERRRFGVMLEAGGSRVLVDASPDVRRCLLEKGLSPKDFDAVFLTHAHYDHIAGLGEFFFQGKSIPLYGSSACLDLVFSPKAYGYLSAFKLFDLWPVRDFEPVRVGPFSVMPLAVDHSIQNQGFLFEAHGKRAAILTDCRPTIPEKTRAALTGCDLLVTDGWLLSENQFMAEHRKFHPELSDAQFAAAMAKKKRNHLLLPEAKELGRNVGAKRTVALHVAHAAGRHAVLATAFEDAGFSVGTDGLVFSP